MAVKSPPVLAVTGNARHGAYYNGFFFPETSRFKAYSRAVPSDNNRTIKYRKLIVSIEFDFFPEQYVTPGGTGGGGESGTIVDWGPNESRVLTNVQHALEQPARNFCIKEGGVGNYCINATKDTDKSVFPDAFTDLDSSDSGRMIYTKDLDSGPKPKLSVFDPYPGENRVHVVWEVELSINTCGLWSDAQDEDTDAWDIASGTVLDVVSAVSYNVVNGLSVRTIDLSIEIVNLYDSTDLRGLELSLDTYALQYADNIPRPLLHQRDVDRRLGEDGKTITLRIVDRQIDSYSPYPIGLRNVSLTYQADSSLMDGAFFKWVTTIDYAATVYPGVPKSFAIEPLLRYLALQNDRESTILLPGGFPGVRVIQNPQQQNASSNPMMEGARYPYSIRLGPNDYFDNSFRMQIVYISCFSLDKLFAISGAADALILNTWQAWNQSTALHSEADGILAMRQDRTHTELQTICGGQVPDFFSPVNQKAIAPLLVRLTNTPPPQEKSWIEFRNQFQIMEKEPIVEMKKSVSVPAPQDAGEPTGNGRVLTLTQQAAGSPVDQQALARPVFQTNVQGEYRVRMYGYAYRLGYEIHVPQLKKYQGANAFIERTLRRDRGMLANTVGGVPVYYAKWSIVYRLDRRPNDNDADTLYAAPIPTLASGGRMAGL